ncbi:peptidoglycan-binding protein [Streptomyces sp. NPDC056708]|uniref:peptidoglycan-binding domain-containing protein n=1 Tax=unclassified Streptomyces TaxID=2593676 RepID=UPI0036AACD0A
MLKTGSRATDVRTAQQLLAAAAYTVTADRAFGPRTTGAVKAVQKRHGLKADGVVGRRAAVSVRPTNTNWAATPGRAAQPGGQTRPGGQRHRGTSQPARTPRRSPVRPAPLPRPTRRRRHRCLQGFSRAVTERHGKVMPEAAAMRRRAPPHTSLSLLRR